MQIRELIILFLVVTSLIYSQNNLPVDIKNYRTGKMGNSVASDYRTSKILGKPDGYSGVWTKVNPSIPAADYLGIDFINPDTGWAVGSNGTIVYTTNGGRKWQPATSPTNNVLINVHSFNGFVVVASGYNGTIVRSTDRGMNWQIASIGTGGNLWEIKMIDDTLGWACGTGPSLLKTTDAGASWNIVNTGFNNFNYWALDYLDKNLLFVAGDQGNILKTTNGGASWQLLQTGFGKDLYRIKAFSESRLIAGGEMGWVARTFNGGISWEYSTAGGEIDAMAFADDSVGFIAGITGADALYKTTDGGITWQIQSQSDVGEYWIMFVNDTLGYNSGADMVIKKTTNKGENWSQQVIKDNFKDVWSLSENTAFAVGGTIYKTTDAGDTWRGIFPYDPANAGLSTIFFLDSLTGFVGTNTGTRIYKTSNGGNSWSLTNISGVNNTYLQINDIFFINDMIGWATSEGLAVIKTTDGGANWAAISNSIGGTTIQFFNPDTGYTMTGYLNKTTDGGNTWTQTSLPNPSPGDMYFFNQLDGLYASYNQFYRTSDGGFNWILDQNITGYNFGKFNWLSSSLGYLVGSQTFYTVDSGNTWANITSDIGGFSLTRMHSGNEFSGFAVGGNGLILRFIDTSYIPVELTSFTSKIIKTRNVLLNWLTSTETNNQGFEIQRTKSGIRENYFKKVGFIGGNGTSTYPHSYSFYEKNLPDGIYKYRLKQLDYNGSFKFSKEIEVNINSTNQFLLEQNYPNPFNSTTVISFVTPKNGNVKILIYNSLGEEVKKLFEGDVVAGKKYRVSFSGNGFSSGIYFYRILQNTHEKTGKMMLIK